MEYQITTDDFDFVQPSINMTDAEKEVRYNAALKELAAIITDDDNMLVRMVTINSVLKSKFSYYFWVGFYVKDGDRLSVGPYQGTMGCKYIDFSRGVCGAAYREGKTQLVRDVHAFPNHIACDSRSQSEIVVPVFDANGKVIAVFDVDSTALDSFTTVDQHYLEKMMHDFFAKAMLKSTYSL